MANVLSSMRAANILSSRGLKEVFTTASPPVPPVSLFVLTVAATASEKDSTAAVITTTTAVTPYTRRTRASRWEYAQAEDVLSLEDKIELITELAKYQKDLAEIKKYQAQQSKLASKTDRRKFYTSVLRSHDGWKTKDFKGMTFEQIEETFIPVWESIQDFVPMDSKLESERFKRPGTLLEKERAMRLKTIEGSEQQSEGNKDVKEKDTVKAPIYDWKIFKDKLREVYQIFRVGQAPKAYPYFEAMLKEFDRDDLVMFEPVATDGMIIYMLDDVEYPLPKTTLQKMLDHKCEVSEFDDDLI
ncbi:hypothetical protein Tco_0298947 [Tanacetum coccineum]